MYFPVTKAPLRMRPSLRSHPSDYGNGDLDKKYFQSDIKFNSYLRVKRSVDSSRHKFSSDYEDSSIHDKAISWARNRLYLDSGIKRSFTSYEQLSLSVQEDFVVMKEGEDSLGKVVAAYVSFPSKWSPEYLLGSNMNDIHSPVPGFPRNEYESRAMVRSMIYKGPYVRFVWTVTPDDNLDHHSEYGSFGSWSDEDAGYFRVERQLTVPFPDERFSIFLVRTYISHFNDLTIEENLILSEAIKSLSSEVAEYKGINSDVQSSALAILSEVRSGN